MSQPGDPVALCHTQSDSPSLERYEHLGLLLHQILASAIALRSSVEQISLHVKSADIAPLHSSVNVYIDLVIERCAALCGVVAYLEKHAP